MKTLYLECSMGAAGDMLTAALLELHDNPKDFLERLNGIGLPGAVVTAEPSVKCGITGTHVKVLINGREESEHRHGEHDRHHEHQHGHSHGGQEYQHGGTRYCDIERLIGSLNVTDNVKKNALEVYKLIAEAESHVHGLPVDKIHFHETGDTDAVADIVGVCILIEEIDPEIIIASPVNTGGGHVRCSHGILPVPAPATAHILQNVPIYNDQTKGELCTPTGAALLKHFVKEFRTMPVITVTKIGYGMGKKDFEKANCVRAYLGTTENVQEEVAEITCNLDDITPESLAFAGQVLLDEGALDVFTVPVGMKKGRTGFQLTCLCNNEIKDKMVSLIFKHTTTLGIRTHICRRYTLQREQTEVQTKYGTVRIKNANGFGVKKSKPEYEDIARIARERGISIQDVLKEIG